MKQALGSIGSVVAAIAAAFCPACTPGLAALLGGVGLSGAASVVVLKPVLVSLLALAVMRLVLGYRRHGRPWPLLAGLTGAGVLYAARWLFFEPALLYAGAGVLLGASTADAVLKRGTRPCCAAARTGRPAREGSALNRAGE